jgi:hypothetical protein
MLGRDSSYKNTPALQQGNLYIMSRHPSQRVQLKLRTKEPLRARIEAAAAERGVSMNAEIEDRLSRSFDTLEETFGSREIFGLLRIVGAAMHEVGIHAGFAATNSLEGSRHWFDSPWAYDQAVRAAEKVFEALRPEGEIVAPNVGGFVRLGGHKLALNDVLENLGAGFANTILQEIGSGETVAARSGKRTRQIRRDLGSMTSRLAKGGRM